MANLRDINPAFIDTISTAAVPFFPVGVSFSPRRIRVVSTGNGQRFTLRGEGMTGPILYDFLSSAGQWETDKPVHFSEHDGVFVTSIGAGQVVYIAH